MTKISELFAEISFKVNGADDLKKFDDQMKSIAANAREAVIALRQLARVQLPKEFVPKGGKKAPSGAAAGGLLTPSSAGAAAGGAAATTRPTVIQSAQFIISTAQILVQQGKAAGGGGGGGRAPVIPSANQSAGGVGWGTIAKYGLGILGVGTLLGAVKALVSNLKEMVASARQAAFATDRLTSSTSLSRRELKQWEYLANKANLGAGTIENTLQRLTANREAMRYGRGNFTPFAQFGIDWAADAGEQLRQFFVRTARDTQAQAEQKAEMLGIDPSIVYARKFLDQGGNLPAGTELSDKQQKAVMELNAAWQEMTFNASALASKLTSDLAPALRLVIDIISSVERMLTTDDGKRQSVFTALTNANPITGTNILSALLPKLAGGSNTNASIHNEVHVTNHGNVPDALKRTGKTVTRAISDAMFGVHPAFADR